ncbi:MAG: tetratricopeptide repeat protein [Chloroflexi bacterium]|nr:MAG: tetratricopeptide repeat protein [Chloroflexota bacterium]
MTTRESPAPRPNHRWLRRGVLILIAAVAVAGGSHLAAPSSPAELAGAATAPDIAAPGATSLDGATGSGAAGGLVPPAERVAFWERRVSAAGSSPSYLDLIYLADAYLDESRASGDLDDLKRAQTALGVAAGVTPDPKAVEGRQALVAFSLHEWQEALRIANSLLAQDPQNLAALGVSGDALLETGQVDAARQRYATLEQLVPSPAVWSRLGRLAFLTGDPQSAIRLVSEAVSGAIEEGYPDAIAFYRFQLGELCRQIGQVDRASDNYEAALTALPDYVPATVGLARTREAQGRRAEAITILERAVARLPQPETVAMLGDLYSLDGNQDKAEQEYALVDGIAQLARATGSVYDRQLTIFDADHDRDLPGAVARAREELAVRGDVYGYDALAWALYKSGDIAGAAAAARQALSLGTPDPRIAFHAGVIAAAQGETDAARTLLTRAVAGSSMLLPLQVPVAEAALAQLEGGLARP